MSLSDLASAGSFASGVAVLISLVYLALQVRQAERNQRAMLQQGRAARATELNLRWAEPNLTRVQLKGIYGDEDMSRIEVAQFFYLFRASLCGIEDTYFQHKHKLLDDESFESTVATLRFTFRTAGNRAAWKMMRGLHDSSFVGFVDRIINEVAVVQPVDNVANWKAAVAAEKTAAVLVA